MWRFALVLIVACSQPSRSPHGGDGKGTAAAPDAAVAAEMPPDAAPAPTPPTEAECDILIDHLLDLMKKADNTPEDRAAAHAKLRPEFLPQCLQLDRAGFDCLIDAPDVAAFSACGA
jgi:hypothetical protein